MPRVQGTQQFAWSCLKLPIKILILTAKRKVCHLLLPKSIGRSRAILYLSEHTLLQDEWCVSYYNTELPGKRWLRHMVVNADKKMTVK